MMTNTVMLTTQVLRQLAVSAATFKNKVVYK